MVLEYEKIWREKWLEDARGLLQWIEKRNKVPISLFIRHSHRKHSDDQEELLNMRLTPRGHQAAVLFGTKIPKNKSVSIYHSEHPRCVETAERIREGCIRSNISCSIEGPIRELLGPMVHSSIGHELVEYGIDGFINRWARGEFPKTQIEPIRSYSTRLWENTVGLQDTRSHEMHIHVSHDLVLMSVRCGILSIEASQSNWIPFLGGFGVYQVSDQFKWYEKGKEYSVVEKH
ncbi:MAG: hypothetical protein GF411_09175 [Candidatus Lokiarchaeota archaeon]|nr:hypothetical protein [Candidatus Lokiarchaeota archaeon]